MEDATPKMTIQHELLCCGAAKRQSWDLLWYMTQVAQGCSSSSSLRVRKSVPTGSTASSGSVKGVQWPARPGHATVNLTHSHS